MRVKKIIFDLIFIVISTMILIIINQYGLLEKHLSFAFIPILIAYYLGRFIERKTGSK